MQIDEVQLQNILSVLHQASSGNQAVQNQVRSQLAELKKRDFGFNYYLLHILTGMPTQSDQVRSTAGLLLKNNLRDLIQAQLVQQPDFVQALKDSCLQALASSSGLVASTIGIVITTLVSKIGLQSWPELLGALVQLLQTNNSHAVESAFNCLTKICEDSGQIIAEQAPDALRQLLPIFIQSTQSSSNKVRIYSLTCVNQFIMYRAQVLFEEFLGPYIQALSHRSTDQVGEVRRLVCQAFVMLLDVRPDVLMPSLKSVTDFMMFAMKDQDHEVALEASEFWYAFAEKTQMAGQLAPLLPQLLPLLVQSMVYSEEDQMTFGDEEDEAVPDRAEDIKPRHHKAKQHQHEHQKEEGEASEEEEEDEDDDELFAEWNLRKCSAATLDFLAAMYGDAVLPVLLPILNQKLFSKEWPEVESGILALGAIADGCRNGIEQHLPQLFPYMIQCLQHPKPLIRNITCWTLSRYCSFAVDSLTTDKAVFFEPMLAGILQCALNNNKRVQEAACSALATIEEEANEELIPYIDSLLKFFQQAFSKYQSKNMAILLDAIGTLAESVQNALARPDYVNVIMPPLINRWNQLHDDNEALFPLLESLTSVAIAVGQHFAPFAAPVYERCIRLIAQTLQAQVQYQQNPSVGEPNADFMIVALDLISGIMQGIGQPNLVSQLIASVQPSLFELLGHCIQSPSSEVRQSAFALIGDLCMYSFDTLKPHLVKYMPILIEQTSMAQVDANLSAVNNACWASGEISMRWGDEIKPFIQPLMERLLPMLSHKELSRTLHENVAICLGRYGLIAPEIVAPQLQNFAQYWCQSLRATKDNEEKISAFRGFVRLVQANINGLLPAFNQFADAISYFQNPPQDLKESFTAILNHVKQMSGAQWPSLYQNFSQPLRERLKVKYNFE